MRASTIAVKRITAFKRSKRLLSSTQKHKRFPTFTVQFASVTTPNSASQVARIVAGDLTSLAADKDTTGYNYAKNSGKWREATD
jgi:hypothetical protein